jgi:flavodoxin
MKACILYISHTGNTRRMAEAMADSLKTPIFNITTTEPSVANNFDLLIIGTPVTGLKPAPEVLSFLARLPQGEGKRAILFCTYALAKGGTLKIMEQELAKKGYNTILTVSKKGVKPDKADFSDAIDEIAKKVKE